MTTDVRIGGERNADGSAAGDLAGPEAVAIAPNGESTAGVSVSHEGEVCRLGGTIDFGTAREALEAVSPIVERGAVRRIDLGGVVRSNSAGLALMIEWLAVARRAGHPLEFVAVPEGLLQLADVCQVEALIRGSG